MSFKKIWWKNLVFIGLFLLLVLFISWIFLPSYDLAPVDVVIPRGADSSEIAKILFEQGVIKNKFLFVFLSKVLNWEQDLKAGGYEFLASNMIEVLRKLREGRIKTYQITIPEGLPGWEVAEILDEKGIVKKDNFLALVDNPGSFKEDFSFFPLHRSLEGYLYPDTYYFTKEENPQKVVRKFLSRFQEVALPIYEEGKLKNSFSLQKVIILASIVEKETHILSEKPIVAAVFYNRLRKGYRLEADPTVKYALGNFHKRLTRDELKTPSPYNTYLHYGLPPGPICSPGRDSIYAVLHSADVEYLYFVAKGDGSHKFSRTYEEHKQAVYKYQKEKTNDSLTSGS